MPGDLKMRQKFEQYTSEAADHKISEEKAGDLIWEAGRKNTGFFTDSSRGTKYLENLLALHSDQFTVKAKTKILDWITAEKKRH